MRPDHRTAVMGILNITPDSFSDGGRFDSSETAFRAAKRMAAQGADLIDLGAQSTRPGASDVGAEIELERLLPVLAEWALLWLLQHKVHCGGETKGARARSCSANLTREVEFAGGDAFLAPENLPASVSCAASVAGSNCGATFNLFISSVTAFDDLNVVVAVLLDKRATVNAVDNMHEESFLFCAAYPRLCISSTALHWAAVHGHEGVVALLLDRRATVNAKDKHGDTPLRLADWGNSTGRGRAAELLRQAGGHQ